MLGMSCFELTHPGLCEECSWLVLTVCCWSLVVFVSVLVPFRKVGRWSASLNSLEFGRNFSWGSLVEDVPELSSSNTVFIANEFVAVI